MHTLFSCNDTLGETTDLGDRVWSTSLFSLSSTLSLKSVSSRHSVAELIGWQKAFEPPMRLAKVALS